MNMISSIRFNYFAGISWNILHRLDLKETSNAGRSCVRVALLNKRYALAAFLIDFGFIATEEDRENLERNLAKNGIHRYQYIRERWGFYFEVYMRLLFKAIEKNDMELVREILDSLPLLKDQLTQAGGYAARLLNTKMYEFLVEKGSRPVWLLYNKSIYERKYDFDEPKSDSFKRYSTETSHSDINSDGMPYFARENGRYGSYPDCDSYGEESNP